MSDVITMTDARRAGYCVRGIRDWAKVNGLDFTKLVRDGISASEFEAIDDALAKRILKIKREREN